MNEDYYLLGQVAEILKVPPYKIVYLISTRQVPEPARIGARRVFTMADIVRISEKLQVELIHQMQTGGTDGR